MSSLLMTILLLALVGAVIHLVIQVTERRRAEPRTRRPVSSRPKSSPLLRAHLSTARVAPPDPAEAHRIFYGWLTGVGVGRDRAPEELERLLRSGSKAVRLGVLGRLAAVGEQSVMPVLWVGLTSYYPNVRRCVVEVLFRLVADHQLDLARAVSWLLHRHDEALRQKASGEVARVRVEDPIEALWPRLTEHLDGEPWWMRDRLLELLVDGAPERMNGPLLALLDHPNDGLRTAAVEALARLADPRALRPLADHAANEPCPAVAARMIHALPAISGRQALPLLLDLMQRRPDLRQVSLRALASHVDRGALPALVDLLAGGEPDLRAIVLELLESTGDPSLASCVIGYVDDPDPEVRSRVRRLLDRWNVGGDALAVA